MSAIATTAMQPPSTPMHGDSDAEMSSQMVPRATFAQPSPARSSFRCGKRKRNQSPPPYSSSSRANEGAVVAAFDPDITKLANGIVTCKPTDRAPRNFKHVVVMQAYVLSRKVRKAEKESSNGKRYDKAYGDVVILSIDFNDPHTDGWVLEMVSAKPPVIRTLLMNTVIPGTDACVTPSLPPELESVYDVPTTHPTFRGVVLSRYSQISLNALDTMWPRESGPCALVRVVLQHIAKPSDVMAGQYDCYLSCKEIKHLGYRGPMEHMNMCLRESTQPRNSYFVHPNRWMYRRQFGSYVQADGPLLFVGARVSDPSAVAFTAGEDATDGHEQSIFSSADTIVPVNGIGYAGGRMFCGFTGVSYGATKDDGTKMTTAETPVEFNPRLYTICQQKYMSAKGDYVTPDMVVETSLSVPLFPNKASPFPGLSFKDFAELVSNPEANFSWVMAGLTYYTMNLDKHTVSLGDTDLQARATSMGTKLVPSTVSLSAPANWIAIDFSLYLMYAHRWAVLLGPNSSLVAAHRAKELMRKDADISPGAREDIRKGIPGTVCVLNSVTAKLVNHGDAFVPCTSDADAEMRDRKMRASEGTDVGRTPKFAYVAISLDGSPHSVDDYADFENTDPNADQVLKALRRKKNVIICIVFLPANVLAHMLAQRKYPWFPTHHEVRPSLCGRAVLSDSAEEEELEEENEMSPEEEEELNQLLEFEEAEANKNKIDADAAAAMKATARAAKEEAAQDEVASQPMFAASAEEKPQELDAVTAHVQSVAEKQKKKKKAKRAVEAEDAAAAAEEAGGETDATETGEPPAKRKRTGGSAKTET